MTIRLSEIASLVSALAWPAAALTIVIVLRKDLGQFLRALPARLSKISAVGFSIELFAAVPLGTREQAALADIREPVRTIPFGSDATASLLALIGQGPGADYAVIDLRAGESWLTSRLYLFAHVLDRFLGVRMLVFVQDAGDIARHFCGIAEPRAVATCLGSRFDWLDKAFLATQIDGQFFSGQAQAEIGALRTEGVDQRDAYEVAEKLLDVARDATRPIDWSNGYVVDQFTNAFLHNKDIRRDAGDSPVATDWVRIRRNEYDEHAEWITNEPKLKSLLGDVLSQAGTIVRMRALAEQDLTRAIAVQSGPYAPVVDHEGRFETLIDVRAALTAASGV